jgi:hypothetical protein
MSSYGYELLDPTGQQMPLPLSTCSIDNSYLVKYCGGCNNQCLVPFDNTYKQDEALTPNHPHLPDILSAIKGLDLSVSAYECDVMQLPRYIPLVVS